jgi:hypothetical protein
MGGGNDAGTWENKEKGKKKQLKSCFFAPFKNLG